MRYFIAFFLLIFGFKATAQNNIEVPASNTNSGTTINTSSPSEQQMDTLKLKEAEQIQYEKTDKKISSKEYRSVTPQSSKNEDVIETKTISQKQSVQAATTSFSTSKKAASTQRTQRSPSTEQQKQMDQVVDVLEENAPGSFEYYYFKYLAGNYNIALIADLKKAEELKPTNSDVQIQMAAYYMITNDAKKSLEYLDKLIASNRLSKDAIAYAEDLLLSAPENGTLITHGFDDTYATAYVQISKKIRTDVRLISLDFLQSEAYRTALKGAGYKMPVNETIDVKYFQEFCSNNPLKNIGVSMTTPKEYLIPLQQHLFVVGLVFEYHADLTYSNFYRNDYLWNKELTKTLINKATTDKAKQLSANYLPMLLYLRKTYEQSGEKDKVKEIDDALDKVSVQCKKYDQVQKMKSSY